MKKPTRPEVIEKNMSEEYVVASIEN